MDGTQQSQAPQIIVHADDLVGVLVHHANKLASYLSVTNWNAVNWAQVDGHIRLMLERAHQAHVLTEQARLQAQAESKINEANSN